MLSLLAPPHAPASLGAITSTDDLGIAATVQKMVAYANEDCTDPLIRAQAAAAMAGCAREDYTCHAISLLAWVKSRVQYVEDPANRELVQHPREISQQIARGQRPLGDCDDHATYLAALAMSVGMPTSFRVIGRGRNLRHVYVLAHGIHLDSTQELGTDMSRAPVKRAWEVSLDDGVIHAARLGKRMRRGGAYGSAPALSGYTSYAGFSIEDLEAYFGLSADEVQAILTIYLNPAALTVAQRKITDFYANLFPQGPFWGSDRLHGNLFGGLDYLAQHPKGSHYHGDFTVDDVIGAVAAPFTGGASLAIADNPVESAIGKTAITVGTAIAAAVVGPEIVPALGPLTTPTVAAGASTVSQEATTGKVDPLQVALAAGGASVAASVSAPDLTPPSDVPVPSIPMVDAAAAPDLAPPVIEAPVVTDTPPVPSTPMVDATAAPPEIPPPVVETPPLDVTPSDVPVPSIPMVDATAAPDLAPPVVEAPPVTDTPPDVPLASSPALASSTVKGLTNFTLGALTKAIQAALAPPPPSARAIRVASPSSPMGRYYDPLTLQEITPSAAASQDYAPVIYLASGTVLVIGLIKLLKSL